MSKLLLKIELVEHQEQRYETVGDWREDENGTICVKVSNTGDAMDAILIGIHEVVEAILCRAHGVSELDVDKFDVAFNRQCKLLGVALGEEPGEDPSAPYFREHAIADVVERLVAASAGVVWCDYEARLNSLFYGEDAP